SNHPLASSLPETPRICTLSLHDALPISGHQVFQGIVSQGQNVGLAAGAGSVHPAELHPGVAGIHQQRDAGAHAGLTETSPTVIRSEEHTSELQSRENLVCRLLLEKKKQT